MGRVELDPAEIAEAVVNRPSEGLGSLTASTRIARISAAIDEYMITGHGDTDVRGRRNEVKSRLTSD